MPADFPAPAVSRKTTRGGSRYNIEKPEFNISTNQHFIS